MDLFNPADVNDQVFIQQTLVPAALQLANMNGMALAPNFDPFQVLGQADIDTALEGHNNQLRQEHQNRFPISDNLFALITTCLADLNEVQRERLSSTMALRGFNIQGYTYQGIRDVFMELFCAPKSSLDNPSLRTSHNGRSFCVLEDGEMDGVSGFWVEDDDTLECGFLSEWEDVFWTYDDTAHTWASHHFRGRKLRRGPPRNKGKGKGKGGRYRFRSRKGKGKGKGKSKGFANYGDDETAYAVKGKSKGKGKGKKGKKGKDKGEGKDGKDPGGKGPSAHVAADQNATPGTTVTTYQDDTWYYDTWWTDDSWWWSEDAWYQDGYYESAQAVEWRTQEWDASTP